MAFYYWVELSIWISIIANRKKKCWLFSFDRGNWREKRTYYDRIKSIAKGFFFHFLNKKVAWLKSPDDVCIDGISQVFFFSIDRNCCSFQLDRFICVLCVYELILVLLAVFLYRVNFLLAFVFLCFSFSL